MCDIMYTSNSRFILIKDNGTDEYESEKIAKYTNNMKSIISRNEWKTGGAGARFMGAYRPSNSAEQAGGETRINGVCAHGAEVIYSATLGGLGGLYRKTLEHDAPEGHVASSNKMQVGRISVFGNSCAASVGSGPERHIAIFDLDTGHYRELTEGDVMEDYPHYSRDGRKIYFASAGLAISTEGQLSGIGPYGVCCYDTETGTIDELFASDRYSYIAPKDDADGGLLFIKRPYNSSGGAGNVFKDIVLFPIRIIKAVGGLLNYFSMAFGGEPLRTGKQGRDVKAKQRDEKELFFDNNVIHAEQALKENERRGEKFPGIIPHTWELIRADRDGRQTCLKKGVMDYTVCKNGDIVYSNGHAVVRLTAGGEQLIDKRHMACNVTEL